MAVAVQFFVNGAVFASFVPRLPEIRDRVDVSIDVFGFAMTSAALLGLVSSAVASGLIGRFGSRRVLVVGSAVLTSALAALGFASSLAAFVICLAIIQFVDVVVDIAMNLQASWINDRRRSSVIHRLHGLWSLGTVVGGISAAVMASAEVSLRAHFVAFGALLGLSVVFVARGLLRADVRHDDAAVSSDRRRVSALMIIGLAGACAMAAEVVTSDWAAFRLRDDLATSPGFAGLGFVAFTSGMTIGRFMGDGIEARFGTRPMMLASASLTAIALTGASFTPNAEIVVGFYLLGGLGTSTIFPKLYDGAARASGGSGAALGALTAGSRIVLLIAPVTVGALAATSLSVGASVAVVTLPALAVFGWFSLSKRAIV